MECAFVGCGAAAGLYAAGLDASTLSLAAVCDVERARAEELVAPRDATAYADIDAMLDAEAAPLVVNLTGHEAHAPVTRRCLRAGRHVFSEKPLALSGAEASDLLALAERRGVALGCAPLNHRSETQRQARHVLADGRLGTVRLAYAHAHVGRVTEWHDDPASFLRVGPLYDGAVYPLNLLVEWFGPVTRVRSADAVDLWPDGESHEPERPTHVEATLSTAGGPVVRLTASFYAPHRSREFTSLELHGDDGSLYVEDAGDMGGSDRPLVSFGGRGRPYTAMPLQEPARETPYLAGPERLAESVRRGAPDRRSASRAAHLVAVCEAIEDAAEPGSPVDVESSVADSSAVAAESPPPVWTPEESAGNDGSAAVRLPPVGFGCSRYRDGDYVDRRESIEMALDAGYRFFDSAELYGNEHRLGEALSAPGSPDRETVFLASKVWNTNHGHATEACESTLRELGTAYVDCYMVHWPEAWAYTGPLRRLAERPVETQEAMAFPRNETGEIRTADVSLEAVWRDLESLHDRGLARTLGLCNVDRETLLDVLDFARIPPKLVQVERHPYRPRTDLVTACHRRGIRVVAHSPLSAPGLLREPAVEEIARERGISPAQVVLAWNVTRGVVPIPSTTDRDHVVENLAASGTRLSADRMVRLDDLADPDFER
ncbi:aldo/keto reductase [Salinirarus marinus]|uniref:aldo/keto reductase n=1 Tax=Salinirarus marinus TaxID=3068310 RepID=UPI003C6C71E2